MAVYIKVKATAIIKIQDPYNKNTIEEAKENLTFASSNELIEEDYQFEIIDAD